MSRTNYLNADERFIELCFEFMLSQVPKMGTQTHSWYEQTSSRRPSVVSQKSHSIEMDIQNAGPSAPFGPKAGQTPLRMTMHL